MSHHDDYPDDWRFLTRDPAHATRAQKVAGGLFLLVLLFAAGVQWW